MAKNFAYVVIVGALQYSRFVVYVGIASMPFHRVERKLKYVGYIYLTIQTTQNKDLGVSIQKLKAIQHLLSKRS